MTIYKITNLINGKVYIGQTIRKLETRWKEHCKHSRIKVSAISSAIRKYGENAFTIECIDTAVSSEELNTKEQQYIKQYTSIAPIGYNLNSGGSNYIDSDTTIERKRLSNLGKKRTDDQKINISRGKSGKSITELGKYLQKLGKHLNSLYCNSGKGIRYSKRDNSYQAFISIDGISKYKSFTLSVFGDRAKELAVAQRLVYENEATEYYKLKIGELNG